MFEPKYAIIHVDLPLKLHLSKRELYLITVLIKVDHMGPYLIFLILFFKESLQSILRPPITEGLCDRPYLECDASLEQFILSVVERNSIISDVNIFKLVIHLKSHCELSKFIHIEFL